MLEFAQANSGKSEQGCLQNFSFANNVNGIPLDAIVNAGNLSEVSYLHKHIKYITKSTKYKGGILLADKGYGGHSFECPTLGKLCFTQFS